jgi:hypothetical protein
VHDRLAEPRGDDRLEVGADESRGEAEREQDNRRPDERVVAGRYRDVDDLPGQERSDELEQPLGE